MKLDFAITEADSREASRLYYRNLAPMGWFWDVALPFACTALGLGIYAYASGNRALAISLFACAAYLAKGCIAQWLAIYFKRAKNCMPGRRFEIDAGHYGMFVTSTEGKSERTWSEFQNFCETKNLLLIFYSPRDFYPVPKRAFATADDLASFRDLLRRNIGAIPIRSGMLAFRHAVAVIALGFIAFFFFGGTLQRMRDWVMQPFQHAFRSRSALAGDPEPVPVGRLHGSGQVYLVPFGDTGTLLSESLRDYYLQKYGLSLHVLAPTPIPGWARDEPRHQLVAEELIECIKRSYPKLADDPSSVIIGVTTEDLYIAEFDWRFSLNLRLGKRIGVISTARLNPTFYGNGPNPDLLDLRFRKLLTKNIGVLYYNLRLSGNPASVLYDDVENVQTLDQMSEDYLVRDAAFRESNVDYRGGDPCLTLRHYFSVEKQRKDSVYLSGCSSTHGETDLEVVNLDLRYGLLLARHSDFYIPNQMPLELSRVLRTQDSRSRAFGVGGTHNLNIFPVGNRWPFTWIELIFEDGGRLHYWRRNWGGSYWDAIYRAQRTSSDFYDSSLTWNWPGWRLVRQDGAIYFFADGDRAERPEQAALMGVQDSSGNALVLQREPSGNLVRASVGVGKSLHFDYDGQHRISRVQDDAGRVVQYRYNPQGVLEEVQDSDHHITHYERDLRNRITRIQVDGRTVLSAEFDDGDRVTRLNITDEGNYAFRYTLGKSQTIEEVSMTTPHDDSVNLEFDGSGYRILPAKDDVAEAMLWDPYLVRLVKRASRRSSTNYRYPKSRNGRGSEAHWAPTN